MGSAVETRILQLLRSHKAQQARPGPAASGDDRNAQERQDRERQRRDVRHGPHIHAILRNVDESDNARRAASTTTASTTAALPRRFGVASTAEPHAKSGLQAHTREWHD
jgi:hypothetical protein